MAKKKKTPYEVLGVPKDASAEQIRKAHRKRALETHPDREGDRDEFGGLSTAISILGNPAKRAYYDATGEEEPEVIDVFAPILTSAYMAIIQEAINKNIDLARVNVVDSVIGSVQKTLDMAKDNLASGKSTMKKMSRARGRLKEPGNVFALCLDAEISRVQFEVNGLSEQVPQVEAALDYLKKCKYEVERDPFGPGINSMRVVITTG